MCDLRYGEVVEVSPLKIRLTPQLTIPSSLLIVPQHLTNYEVEVNTYWETSTDSETESHSHSVSGGTLTINNELKLGDKVALLRKQGGQSYFILDKI